MDCLECCAGAELCACFECCICTEICCCCGDDSCCSTCCGVCAGMACFECCCGNRRRNGYYNKRNQHTVYVDPCHVPTQQVYYRY